MEWIFLAALGAFIGALASSITLLQEVHLPLALGVILGAAGSIAGGALIHLTQLQITAGETAIYVAGAIVAIGFLAGGFLGFSLTSSEKRI